MHRRNEYRDIKRLPATDEFRRRSNKSAPTPRHLQQKLDALRKERSHWIGMRTNGTLGSLIKSIIARVERKIEKIEKLLSPVPIGE